MGARCSGRRDIIILDGDPVHVRGRPRCLGVAVLLGALGLSVSSPDLAFFIALRAARSALRLAEHLSRRRSEPATLQRTHG